MVFSTKNNIQKRDIFAVIGSIVAVTALATSGAATTQLAFAQEGTGCRGCRVNALGEGIIICGDNTQHQSSISISATKGKGGSASGTLTITTDSGITATGTITSGKISGAKYSLQGTWNPNSICGASGTTSFTTSGPTGTQVPINFQSSAIASSSFTGTAQTTTPG